MTAAGETASPAAGDTPYDLTLFVSGASGLSARAIDDVRLLRDVHLDARSRLTVVDIHAAPPPRSAAASASCRRSSGLGRCPCAGSWATSRRPRACSRSCC